LYYFRSGSTNQELKGTALDRFLLQRHGKRWDSVPVPYVSISDLSVSAFDSFRRNATKSLRMDEDLLKEDNDILLEKLHLKEGKFIKRAAVLLFHDDPEKYVTGSYVKIGFFRTDADLLYQDAIHGNLFDQVEKTIDLLLTKYLIASISYEHISRVEKYPFPESALREAVLNSIIHKDYGSGNPIQISVYSNKILFWNEGQLPDTWTIERLLSKHPSMPFNPDIASVFFRAGLIEAWGRGTIKMIDDCIKEGVNPPKFSFDANGVLVEFESETTIKTVKKTVKKAIKKNIKKTDTRIIEIIEQEPDVTIEKLAQILGNISYRGVYYYIKKMKNNGILERIGGDKGGSWKINKKE
jgi:ATP-dependent DNA helicase RecG